MANTKPIHAFLSCSLHPNDKAIVDFIEAKLFTQNGFTTFTVGRNVSGVGYPPDVIIQRLKKAECLAAIVTARSSEVSIIDELKSNLRGAPYVEQEAAIAIASNIPVACFKAKGVALPGMIGHKMYIEFDPSDFENSLRSQKTQVVAYIKDLKGQVLRQRRDRLINGAVRTAKNTLATIGAGGILSFLMAPKAPKPDCFGLIDLRYTECKECPIQAKCRAKKEMDGD